MDHFRYIYSCRAADYHHLISPEDCEHNLLPALQQVAELPGKRILDLGTGTGRLPLLLGHQAEQRLGLKVSQVDSTRDLAMLSPRPVLIIHGAADHLFSPDHALKMYAAAKEPKTLWLIEGSGHANLVTDHEAEYRERVVMFFEKAFAPEE